MLNQITLGDAALPSMLFAHGLYGQCRNLGMITRKLQDIRHCISVDMRNHGDSPRYDSHSYEDMAADLAQSIENAGSSCDLLGHSMGGKAAMVLALSRPELVNRLVVADIAPVPYSHDQMSILNAMRALDLSQFSRRQDAARALIAKGLDQGTAGFLTQSIDIASQAWKINLDTLAGAMPDIMDFPIGYAPFNGPALFLAGANSAYVKPEYEAEIYALFPQAKIVRIENAGHWLHAEQPDAVSNAIRDFLTS